MNFNVNDLLKVVSRLIKSDEIKNNTISVDIFLQHLPSLSNTLFHLPIMFGSRGGGGGMGV